MVRLGAQAGSLFAIVFVSVISILLNITATEIATEGEYRQNHELKAMGITNLIAGLGGSSVSYHALTGTMLSNRIGARSRLVGIFLAVICVLVMFFGGALLSYFPPVVLGGVLAFIGLDLLSTWLVDGWSKLPRVDYAIVILIMLIIYFVGFFEGVGSGIGVATLLFVIRYSRVSPVRHELSGNNFSSNVVRPRLFQRLLRQKGEWLHIVKLHGFIFFGAASSILDRVKARLDDPDTLSLKYVILDMERVTGIDSSAIFNLEKMKQLAGKKNFTIVFTHISPAIQRQMEVLFKDDADQVCRIFPDLDHGVEWCENEMIETFESVGIGARPGTLIEQLVKGLSLPENVTKFMQYLERQEVEEGTFIIRQGDAPTGMYFMEKGEVVIQVEGDVRSIRLRKMGTGTVVGELGLYTATEATANVIASEACTLYYLSADRLEEMEARDPAISNQFHRFMSNLLSERLIQTTSTLKALAD